MQSISGQYKNKNNHCNICLFPVKIDYRGCLPIDHDYITLVRSSQPSIRVLQTQTLPPRGESNRIESNRKETLRPRRFVISPQIAHFTLISVRGSVRNVQQSFVSKERFTSNNCQPIYLGTPSSHEPLQFHLITILLSRFLLFPSEWVSIIYLVLLPFVGQRY